MTRNVALQRAGEVLLVLVAIAIELMVWGGDRTLRWGGGRLPVWLLPTVSVLALSTLWWRRRHPGRVFAAQISVTVFSLICPGFQPFVGILVALYAVTRQHPARVARTALLLCAIPFTVNAYNTGSLAAGGFLPAFAETLVLWVVVTLTIWGFARLARSTEAQAAEAMARQSAEAALLLQAERLRLARELHDSVANAVTGILLQAAGARTVLTRAGHVGATPDVTASLDAIEAAGVQAITELHHLLGLLRSPDHHGSNAGAEHAPGVDAVPLLLKQFEAAGLELDVTITGRPRDDVDAQIGLALYRVLQESLSNCSKHAGPRAAVALSLSWTESDVEVVLVDRALSSERRLFRGRIIPSSGLGLRGLAERVELLGGTFAAAPTGSGFRVRTVLPLDRDAAHRFGHLATGSS